MDAGGSEFAQIFTLSGDDGSITMQSDGESRNSALLWDREGNRLAFQSTRRDGRANDVWIMDADAPQSAGIALAADDGSWWGPVDFSADGNRLLLNNYHSIADSRGFMLDLATGERRRVDGAGERASTNELLGFSNDGKGVFFITSQYGEFNRLAYRGLADGADTEVITGDIDWDVYDFAFDESRRRAAFVVNEGGIAALYLLDPDSRRYRRIDSLPPGVISNLGFSPDGRKLALTLNSPTAPSDTYVLALGRQALAAGELQRWTYS
jgi:Tol biopolymer transport system component